MVGYLIRNAAYLSEYYQKGALNFAAYSNVLDICFIIPIRVSTNPFVLDLYGVVNSCIIPACLHA